MDEGKIQPFHFAPDASLDVVHIGVFEEPSADKEKAGHVEEIDEIVEVGRASAVADNDEEDAKTFGDV